LTSTYSSPIADDDEDKSLRYSRDQRGDCVQVVDRARRDAAGFPSPTRFAANLRQTHRSSWQKIEAHYGRRTTRGWIAVSDEKSSREARASAGLLSVGTPGRSQNGKALIELPCDRCATALT